MLNDIRRRELAGPLSRGPVQPATEVEKELMPDSELSHPDANVRVIHLLDQAGKVIAIGWEPACIIEQRRHALAATVNIITRASDLLSLIYDRKHTEILETPESRSLVDAMADLRVLIPAMGNAINEGMKFPWPPSAAKQTHERFRRAA